MTIFVDADACPVKREIVQIASHYMAEVVFVASYTHMKTEPEPGKWVFVDSVPEAADLYIMNHASKGDVAVTQDIGLASTLLSKGVYVLSPRGMQFDERNMQTALEMRHISAKARRQGKYGKGPKPYEEEDRQRFLKEFAKVLSKLL